MEGGGGGRETASLPFDPALRAGGGIGIGAALRLIRDSHFSVFQLLVQLVEQRARATFRIAIASPKPRPALDRIVGWTRLLNEATQAGRLDPFGFTVSPIPATHGVFEQGRAVRLQPRVNEILVQLPPIVAGKGRRDIPRPFQLQLVARSKNVTLLTTGQPGLIHKPGAFIRRNSKHLKMLIQSQQLHSRGNSGSQAIRQIKGNKPIDMQRAIPR